MKETKHNTVACEDNRKCKFIAVMCIICIFTEKFGNKSQIILSIAYMQAYYNLESESIPWFDQSCMFSFIALFYKLHFIIYTFKTHAVNNKKEKVAIEKGDKLNLISTKLN